jgi:hypothetical protein
MITFKTCLASTQEQTLSNTVFGSLVVLLEDHPTIGKIGTVVLVLSGPVQPCILPLNTDHQYFQLYLFDDTNRKIKCRPFKDGESITITESRK